MAFNNDITLAGTSTSYTYSIQSWSGGNSVRTDASATLGEPRTLTIKHQQTTRAGVIVDRHLIRLDHVKPGVSPDPDVTPSVQLVIEAPRKTAVAADIQDLVTRMTNFIGTAGYLTKVLANEP